MMKCKMCGEFIDSEICPFCGYRNTSIDKKEVVNDKDILSSVSDAKSKLVENCVLSVVKLSNQQGIMLYTGTGWLCEQGYIISNAHVVCNDKNKYLPTPSKINCEFAKSLSLPDITLKVVYFDADDDIAILKPVDSFIPSSVNALKIKEEAPKIGELVFTIGNPLHYKFTYTEGAVANPQYNAGGKRKFTVLQTTLTLNHGNSGGPVFDAKGNVVGMTTFSELKKNQNCVYEEIRGYGFCVTGEAILSALKSI